MIDKYLKYLSEGKDYKDPSLPNPYDYKSIELDPKIKQSDIDILGKWLKQNKKFFPKGRTLHPYHWLYSGSEYDDEKDPKVVRKESKEKPYIIVDNGKRVGFCKNYIYW